MIKLSLLASAAAFATFAAPAMAAPLTAAKTVVYTAEHHAAAQQTIVADAKGKTYKVDDGSSENAVALTFGQTENYPALWFNQFTTVAGGEAISSVSIAWGTPSNSTPAATLNGQKVTIAIWSDPNNDGNPSDAKLLAKVKGTVSSANNDMFVTYTFSTPVYVGPAGTNFFVGDETPAYKKAAAFIESLDQTASAGKSWIAFQSSMKAPNIKLIGKNDTVATIDNEGLPGNWLIRATGVKSSGK